MYTNSLNNIRAFLAQGIETLRAPEIEASAVGNAKIALQIGQIVNAVVVNRLDNSRLIATIEGQQYNLRLPTGATVGQSLQLEVLNDQPTLLFRMLSAPQGTSADMQDVKLSDTARWLVSANASLSESENLQTAIRTGSAPLVQNPTNTAPLLADHLRSAISESGLFYESHQALWVDGKFSLDALRKEPQGSLPSALEQQASSPVEKLPSSTINALLKDESISQPVLPKDESLPIVRQQMATLTGSPVEWIGQAWPGQQLHLSITRDEEPGHFANPAFNGWQTRLALDLPNLGTIEAMLHLSHAGIRITIDTKDAASVDSLRASATELLETFSSLGFKVLALGLQHA